MNHFVGVAFSTDVGPWVGILSMPHLNADAISSDIAGLEFLRDVIDVPANQRVPRFGFSLPVEPVDVTIEAEPEVSGAVLYGVLVSEPA